MIVFIIGIIMLLLALFIKTYRTVLSTFSILIIGLCLIVTFGNMNDYKLLSTEKEELNCIQQLTDDGKPVYKKKVTLHNEQCDRKSKIVEEAFDISAPFREHSFEELKIHKQDNIYKGIY